MFLRRYSPFFFLVFFSCAREDAHEVASDLYFSKAAHDVAKMMSTDYLWSEKVRAGTAYKDPTLYKNPVTLLSLLKVSEDRFTFILPKEEEARLLGTPVDFGFSTRYLEDTLYVSYVYEGSPAYRAGLRRGHPILHINNRVYTPKPAVSPRALDATTLQVDFIETEGKAPVRVEFSRERYQQKGVTTHRIVVGEHKNNIGYLHFNSFLLTSYADELREVFSLFKDEDVQDLVVDLRYNRGGYESVALVLASLIFADGEGKVFAMHRYNQQLERHFEAEESTLRFRKEPLALSLSRCFFLVNERTASASELLVHALRPYMEVFVVGSGTVGKNVGSYRFYLPLDYKTNTHIFHPIVFKIFNAEGLSYERITPTHEAIDDVSRLLGDPDEAMFSAALHYIKTGSFPHQFWHLVSQSARREHVQQATLSFTEEQEPLLVGLPSR